jgi:RES domain-containing protein
LVSLGFADAWETVGVTLERKRYDVSLSFAGEDRLYVSQVAAQLQNSGVRVFYDDFEQVQLWGKDLLDRLGQIYRNESECVVMFISEAYKRRDWTDHERRHSLATALRSNREYVLPVKFDDTELEGLPPSVAYVDARRLTPRQLGELLIQKLRSLGVLVAEGDSLPPPGTTAWRIASHRFATDLRTASSAASRFAGRWNPAGIPVIYAGATYCAALFELLVDLPDRSSTKDFVAIPIRIPASVRIKTIYESSLPADWRNDFGSDALRDLGAAWVQSLETCVLSVPSAAVPHDRLLVINPAHPDFSSLEVLPPEPVMTDRRLFAGH